MMKIEELCLATSILCVLIDNVVSNLPPRFAVGGDMAHFSIPENVDVGSTIYKLRGNDPEGSSVHFSISGEYFSVNKYTGDVTLIKELDRELSSNVEVIISITDEAVSDAEANTVSIRREIPIIDVNDNPPVFGSLQYSSSVSEDIKVGTIVYSNITISDRDFGLNSMVNLFCVQSPACQNFQVSLQILSEGYYKGIITLMKPLNYEVQSSHTLWLKAIDSNSKKPLSATAKVIIDVQDVQDQPPIFINTPYSISVPENTPRNKKVLNVEARDGDVKNLRPIFFSLEEDVLHYFSIQNLENGKASIITTNTPIDREDAVVVQMGGIYTFYVKATEFVNETSTDSSRELVTIVILDENDQLPKFNKLIFSVNVSEDIGVGTPIPGLGIIASDDDMGDNARFSLTLRSNDMEFMNWFSVEPVHIFRRSPVIIRVVNNTGLDFENGIREIKLYVIAFVLDEKNDPVEVASSEINLHIIDVNDNYPQFAHSNYLIDVPEDTNLGTLIANITAIDRDSGLFSQIVYSVGGFGMDKFDTNPKRGGLILVNKLDYEQQVSYWLTLRARDGGNKTTTVNIIVNVIDVNDNAPVFEQAEYRRNIREGLTSFQPQFLVKATDLDGPLYKRITYAIVSSNSDAVGIDVYTGELKMLVPASSQHTTRGQYEIKIQANDSGVPALFSQALIFIRVGLPGNQRPFFKDAPYNATIPETLAPNSLITTVRASDPDGLDETLEYKMAVGADNFYIEPRSGMIYLADNSDLSSSTVKHYNLTVMAIDSGMPYRETAQATVTINLIDINDKPPVFLKDMNYVSYTSEKKPVGSVVMKVQAVDPDESADLRYTLLKPFKVSDSQGFNLEKDKNNYNDLFILNEKTGEISIQQSLDNLPIHVVTMMVEVRDKNAVKNIESQVDSVEVTIFLEATEELKPIFLNTGWTRSNPIITHNMLEELPIGSNILTLIAYDPLAQSFIQNFETKSLPRQFAMDPVGNIVLTERIDYETTPTKLLNFVVEAIADDYKRSEANVTINVVDINDHSPQFENKYYQGSVEENSQRGTLVLTVHAHDSDLKSSPQGYGNISYHLSGEHAFLFEMNSTTGEMRVGNNVIDRERQSALNLIAIAVDTPLGGKDTRKSEVPIQINVLDINDNDPSFKEKEYKVVILENINVGASVINITAFDPDIGPAGIIKYDLIDESDSSGLFKINPETGEITVQKSLTGRGRNFPYLLMVRAEDNGDPVLFKDVQINVLISDVVTNDGVPVFVHPKENEIIYISEDAPMGSAVFQVKGMDPDDPFTPEGQIQYSLLRDRPDMDSFNINPSLGLITTKVKLDRETKDSYSLIVLIKDGGVIPQQATRVLIIKVTDADDNLPFFKRSIDEKPLQIQVREEQALGSVVGSFKATDLDEKQNAEIDYLITEGNANGLFSISESNNSAILQTAARIDREKISHLILTIKCFRKRDKPKMLHKKYNRTDFSERQLDIRILDIDDNLPEFTEKNITVGIRFNAPIDFPLLTVTAEDVDAEAEPIMYYIVNISFVQLTPKHLLSSHLLPFILHNRTGELRTNASLRKFVGGYFILEVAAVNSYTNNYSINYVKIYVIREHGLLKFIFSKSPAEVKEYLPQFKSDLESALTIPSLQVNVYETQFHSKEDGSFDFLKTASCFQIINNDHNSKEIENIFEDRNSEQLQQVFDKYYVESIQQCGDQTDKTSVTWVQISLLSIATLIGAISVVSTCILCCSYSRWQRLK